MRARRGQPRIWWVAMGAVGAAGWPALAQQTPPHKDHAPAPAAAVQQGPHREASVLDGVRNRFENLLERTIPAWERPGKKRKVEMFNEFLTWPRNPVEVELTVRLTFPIGVGPVVGTLGVRNSEILVAGRTEPALFIRPSLKGLPPGLYAFHVHENADCGPALKDGESVPGLAAGSHLWLSGTGALSGTTFASHLGDLPDLQVDADGTAKKVVVAARLTLADVVKRSFIIHASQDDSSARVACAAFD